MKPISSDWKGKWRVTDEAKNAVLSTLAEDGYLDLAVVRTGTNDVWIQGKYKDMTVVELGPFAIGPGDSLTLQGVKLKLEIDL